MYHYIFKTKTTPSPRTSSMSEGEGGGLARDKNKQNAITERRRSDGTSNAKN